MVIGIIFASLLNLFSHQRIIYSKKLFDGTSILEMTIVADTDNNAPRLCLDSIEKLHRTKLSIGKDNHSHALG